MMMKKLLPLLCITSLFLSGCFQEKTTPVRKYYENGEPKVLGYYLEKTGKKHGEWTYYFENGKLMRTEKYEDGKLISKKGLTRFEKVFEKGELVWHKPINGVGFVDENNKKSGEWKFYDENGKLRQIGSYMDGKREGEWKHYHKNGKLSDIGSYRDGKQEGGWKEYDESGELRDGEWKRYYENGELLSIGSYKAGKKEGEFKFYRDNGKLLLIFHYRNGERIRTKIL